MKAKKKKAKREHGLYLRVTAQEYNIMIESAAQAGFNFLSEWIRTASRFYKPRKKHLEIIKKEKAEAS